MYGEHNCKKYQLLLVRINVNNVDIANSYRLFSNQ